MQILNYSFSDAGMVFYAQAFSTYEGGVLGYWFWDYNELKLLFLEGKEYAGGIEEGEGVAFPIDGCDYSQGGSIGGNLFINDAGDILLNTSATETGDEFCPEDVVLKFSGDDVTVVARNDDLPLNQAQDDASVFGRSLARNGDASYMALYSPGLFTHAWAHWIFEATGESYLVATSSELVPPDYNLSLLPSMAQSQSHYPVANSNGAVAMLAADENNYDMLMVGSSYADVPYNSAFDSGTSALNLVVRQNDIPPGMASTDYVAGVGEPFLTSSSNTLFYTVIDSALDDAFASVYRVKQDGSVYPLFTRTFSVNIDGETYGVGSVVPFIEHLSTDSVINVFGRTPGNGYAQRFSDTGKLIMFVTVGGDRRILYTSYE